MSDETHTVTVYRYGLRPPLDWGDDCEDELARMTALWNTLVEIEEAHREAVAALTERDDEAKSATAAVDAAMARRKDLVEARAEKRKAGRRRVPTPELDAAITALSGEIKTLAVQAKEARRAARERLRPELATLAQRRYEAVKAARNASGLYWGNYNAVCASYERARGRAMQSGGELRFRAHRRRPEQGGSRARLVNQIQGGTTPAELLAGECSQASLALDPSGRRGLLRLTVHRRDGERRQATWPIVMDRPLPEESRIQEITVHRRAVADRWEWSVSFLLRVPPPDIQVAGARACGLDLGWRRINDGIRVATVVAEDGTRDFITLPETFVRRQTRIEELASVRAQKRNELLAALAALDWASAPEELRAAANRAVERKRYETLHDLALAWRRFPNWQADVARTVSEWRRQDRKDWQELEGLRRRITNARQYHYRVAVKALVERFGSIGIEDVDWRALAARVRSDGTDNDIARATATYRNLASPGLFLLELRRAAQAAGARIHAHAGKSTWLCAECGNEAAPVDRAELYHTCASCGATWDQDVNAARNLLAAARASAPVASDGRAALAWEMRP
jgi:hypothetical protein